MINYKGYIINYSEQKNGYYIQKISISKQPLSQVYENTDILKKKIDNIEELKKEFYFITSSGEKTIYHAKETENGYEISWRYGEKVFTGNYSKEHVYRMVFNGIYHFYKKKAKTEEMN